MQIIIYSTILPYRYYTNNMGLEASFTDLIVIYIPKTTLLVVLQIHVVAGEGVERSFKLGLFSS